MMRFAQLAAVVMVTLVLSACQSTHEKGVSTNYLTQWTTVSADTKQTTEAARAVLEDQGLKDVESSSTNIDGKATAKKADGTKIRVTIAKQKESTSQVSVTVGTVGEPVLGAELAKKIKLRAEGATTRPS